MSTETLVKKKGRKGNCGRKPVADKKITVSFYPRMSRIENLGIDGVKEIALSAVEKEYFRNLKKSS